MLTQISNSYSALSKVFSALVSEDKNAAGHFISEELFDNSIEAINTAVHHNGWFVKAEIHRALSAWVSALSSDQINEWLSSYRINEVSTPKTVAIIMAGNIPIVGLHDLLSTLASGNIALIKLSSKDSILMMMVIQILKEIDPSFTDRIQICQGKLEGFDAVIATGSNNSARYFEYYFREKPSIIRKNRTSVAILTGEESEEQMTLLGSDIFSYFGLGCRNVTKLYIPKDYNLDKFFNGVFAYKDIVNHNKYANNFDYHRAVWLMNKEDLLENGFLLLKQDKHLVSPVGSIFFEFYNELESLESHLEDLKEEIQCVVSSIHTPFGRAQLPALKDYADGVDTLQFLSEL